MSGLTSRSLAVLGFVLCACPGNDDNPSSDDTTGATAGTGTSTMTTTTTTADADTVTPDDTTTGTVDPTTDTPPDTSTGPDPDSTDTGPTVDGVVLQNDSWDPLAQISWQLWPNATSCWASTFAPDNAHYPFQIVGVHVAIGDEDVVETFEIGVWDVDNQGMPTEEIDSATIDIDGGTGDLTQIDFAELGLNVPAIQNGDFAIVMCHTTHMAPPSIATDADGVSAPGRNWARSTPSDDWEELGDLVGGIAGDYILRAVIQPE